MNGRIAHLCQRKPGTIVRSRCCGVCYISRQIRGLFYPFEEALGAAYVWRARVVHACGVR